MVYSNIWVDAQVWHDTNLWQDTYAEGIFDEAISELEKDSVSTVYIDYWWIEPGLADRTPLDEVIEELEK